MEATEEIPGINEPNSIPVPVRWTEPSVIAFWTIHAIALIGAFFTPLTKTALILLVVNYLIRIWGITAGYHRYFSHRSYKTGRVFQFILAWCGAMAAQKGPIWWSSHHRVHHRYSDTIRDVHSPWYGGGFWWSHVGWILSGKWDQTHSELVQEWYDYPEIVWIENNKFVPPMLLGITCFLIGGFPGLIWGFFFSTVLNYHCTFFINSLAHHFGRQRYRTTDTSRNSLILALLTLGEGWHNNHHYYQSSCAQGFYWWEIDISYYTLKVASWFGIVWDIKTCPEKVREANHYEAYEIKMPKFDKKSLQQVATNAAQAASESAANAAEAARLAAARARDAANDTAQRWADAAREAAANASEAAGEAASKATGSVSLATARAAQKAHTKAHDWQKAAQEASEKVAELFSANAETA